MQVLLRPLALIWRAITFWWDDWLDQLLLNLVWAVCCLTIILGPPATFAMAYASNELARGSVESIRNLVPIARRYFWESWLWVIVNLIVLFILLSSIFFYSQLGQPWSWALAALAAVILAGWIVVQLYSLPLFFIQDDSTLRLAWRNAGLLAAKHPITSFIILLYTLTILLITVGSGIFLVFGGITLLSVLGAIVTRNLLSRELGIDLEKFGDEEE